MSSSSAAAASAVTETKKKLRCDGKCGKQGCTKSYASASGLSAHVAGDKQRKHPCTYDGCDKSFHRRRFLEDHVNAIHTKSKPHKCRDCEEAFATAYELRLHERKHPPRSLPTEQPGAVATAKKAEEDERLNDAIISAAASSFSSSAADEASTASSSSDVAAASAAPALLPDVDASMFFVVPDASDSDDGVEAEPVAHGGDDEDFMGRLYRLAAERLALLELLPRADDFAHTALVRHRSRRLVVARVPSLAQLVPGLGEQPAETCAYYALDAYERLAASAPLVADAFDELAKVVFEEPRRSMRVPWQQLDVPASLARALDALRQSSRAEFVAKYRRWLVAHMNRFVELSAGALGDDEERRSLELFELATRQVADVWPDVTLLALGNDGRVDAEAFGAALGDTLPNHARDVARVEAASQAPVPVLVVDGAHYVTLVVRRLRIDDEPWTLVLATDSIGADWSSCLDASLMLAK